MTQGLYLIADPNADQKKLCEQFKQICLTQTPDALLFDPKGKSKEKIKSFLKTVQDKNTAFIFKGDVELALELQADGVQIAYTPEIKKIRKQTADISLGVICDSRDEAMRAGEAGADYIGFENENAAELTVWWSELFTVPCVDFTPDCPAQEADFQIQFLNG